MKNGNNTPNVPAKTNGGDLKPQSRSLYEIFSSGLGLRGQGSRGSSKTEGVLAFLFPAIVVILIVVLSAVIKQEMDRMLLEEKLIEKRFEIALVAKQADNLTAETGDWESAHARYLNTILLNIEMLDQVDMTYAAVFDEQLQNLSARSPSYEGSPFEPAGHSEFVEAVRASEIGDLVMPFTPPGSQMRPMYLHYRWAPSDKALSNRVLLVTAISKFSLNARISTWVQISTIVLVLLSFVMTLFVWRRQAPRSSNASDKDAPSSGSATSQLPSETASVGKGRFFDQMSRKLEAHIDTISEQSSMIQSTSPETSEAHAAGKRVAGSAVPLTQMLSDMQHLARIRSGTLALENSPFSLKALLREVVEALSIPMAEKQIRLTTNVDQAPDWTLEGDAAHLNQVLHTLLINAVKYSDTGAEVRLRVDAKMKPGQEAAQVGFAIVDEGAGLSDAHLETVHDAFKRSNITASCFEDVGAGLSISCALVSLMGGTITVQSEQNKGSVFAFAVPLDRVQ